MTSQSLCSRSDSLRPCWGKDSDSKLTGFWWPKGDWRGWVWWTGVALGVVSADDSLVCVTISSRPAGSKLLSHEAGVPLDVCSIIDTAFCTRIYLRMENNSLKSGIVLLFGRYTYFFSRRFAVRNRKGCIRYRLLLAKMFRLHLVCVWIFNMSMHQSRHQWSLSMEIGMLSIDVSQFNSNQILDLNRK